MQVDSDDPAIARYLKARDALHEARIEYWLSLEALGQAWEAEEEAKRATA